MTESAAPAALPEAFSIGDLRSGPEMDALVAEFVMGWEPNAKHPSLKGEGWWRVGIISYTAEVPFWSTDDAAALEVLKLLASRRPNIVDAFGYSVTVLLGKDQVQVSLHGGAVAFAPTLALAICRAALKASLHAIPNVSSAASSP